MISTHSTRLSDVDILLDSFDSSLLRRTHSLYLCPARTQHCPNRVRVCVYSFSLTRTHTLTHSCKIFFPFFFESFFFPLFFPSLLNYFFLEKNSKRTKSLSQIVRYIFTAGTKTGNARP